MYQVAAYMYVGHQSARVFVLLSNNKKEKFMKMLFRCGLLESSPVLRKWDVVK